MKPNKPAEAGLEKGGVASGKSPPAKGWWQSKLPTEVGRKQFCSRDSIYQSFIPADHNTVEPEQ
ncbi:MAG: hypothetical protein FJ267_10625 [Planctomycetes bacterium]|nr:hypothetical protein [Planctomycetota bacterium]